MRNHRKLEDFVIAKIMREERLKRFINGLSNDFIKVRGLILDNDMDEISAAKFLGWERERVRVQIFEIIRRDVIKNGYI